ncbi:MAG: lysophospholipid acyltransferase family protein, partial [Verrucomicrobiota bacterium]
QRIYFANHTSHLDAVVLWSAVPSELRARTRPVAARDYWTKSKLRNFFGTKVFNAVLVDRERGSAHKNPLEPLLQALNAGDSLIIFPEGTRSSGANVQPFKSGVYHLARKCPSVELIPVHIDNMNRILPKSEILPVPLMSCISFGEPMHLLDNESKTDFLERARTAVSSLQQL